MLSITFLRHFVLKLSVIGLISPYNIHLNNRAALVINCIKYVLSKFDVKKLTLK